MSTSLGLTAAAARDRLVSSGANLIRLEKEVHPAKLLLRQFSSPLIWLLLLAALAAGFLGEWVDAVAIAAILILNALIGFLQEYRAERAVFALRKLSAPTARALRDGTVTEIAARDVVPGDVLLLEAGDVVAADARLLEAHELRTSEAALTGESAPVDKSVRPTAEDAPLAERTDRVFASTSIVAGTAKAEVFATGMKTELGKIAHLLAQAGPVETPLQKRLRLLSRQLLVACLGVVALVAALGYLRGQSLLELTLNSISLAVAIVPEGLPAIVTIALALGVQRMASRHVLVRNLPSVETLGSVTVICTDKTGTLTAGRMQVREIWGEDHLSVVRVAASCCDAEWRGPSEPGIGDPTELAILGAAAGRGIFRNEIERDNPRVTEHPFDSERKRMSVYRRDGVLYVKGAVESVFSLCRGKETDAAHRANQEMADEGLRVLAVATGTADQEADLVLTGLLGIADPPRTEAIDAVADARQAGIRTVMITGDHPRTAAAIAREMGILLEGDDPSEIVHARAAPATKIDIVRKWKSRGEVVAMTGDGVNDAPALKEAHIGIAMGKTGTQVTREASDMILTDDNFASIIAAVNEGRAIYHNIRKSVVYLLTGNMSEVLVMVVAVAIGLPIPFLPIHLLWINLVTDGFPALALVADPADRNLLKANPRPAGQPMLGRREWRGIGVVGAMEAGLVLALYAWLLGPQAGRSETEARTLAFCTLVFSQLLRSFSARSETRIFWKVGPLTNLWLLGVVGGTASLQVALTHLPWTREIFELSPLHVPDLVLTFAVGAIPVTALETLKLIRGYKVRRP